MIPRFRSTSSVEWERGSLSWVGERLASWSQHQKELLILIGVDYVVGYAVWAVHSLKQGLGPGDAADLQYLFAGFWPLLGLALLLALVDKSPGLIAPAVPQAIITGLTAVSMVASFSIVVGLWLNSGWGSFALIVAAAGVCLSSIFTASSTLKVAGELQLELAEMEIDAEATPLLETVIRTKEDSRQRTERLLSQAKKLGLVAGVFALAAAVPWYVTEAFPAIPQELGGGQPFCRQLDFSDASKYPASTRSALSPDLDDEIETASSEPSLVEVEVLADRGSTLVLRAPDSDDADRPVVALNKAEVAAMLPCDWIAPNFSGVR